MRARSGSVLILALLLPALPVSADHWDHYKDGEAALERGDWARAEESFLQAIEDRSKSGKRVRDGLKGFRRYLPHFHLGRALLEQEKYGPAQAAFDQAEAQGAIDGLKEELELVGYRQRCQDFFDRCTELSEAARAELNAAYQALGALAARRESATLRDYWESSRVPDIMVESTDGGAPALRWRETERSLEERRADAEAQLTDAENRLDVGEAACNIETIDKMMKQTRNVAQQLTEADGDAARVDEVVEGWVAGQRLSIETRRVKAREALKATEFLQPYSERVERLRATLLSAIEPSIATMTQPALLDLLAEEAEEALALYQTETAPPPEDLGFAAGKRMKGDHEGVINILEAALKSRAFGDDARSRAHAHLLIAASNFALYRLSGERDSGRRLEALAAARRAREADPAIAELSETLYSPEFRAFFATE